MSENHGSLRRVPGVEVEILYPSLLRKEAIAVAHNIAMAAMGVVVRDYFGFQAASLRTPDAEQHLNEGETSIAKRLFDLMAEKSFEVRLHNPISAGENGNITLWRLLRSNGLVDLFIFMGMLWNITKEYSMEVSSILDSENSNTAQIQLQLDEAKKIMDWRVKEIVEAARAYNIDLKNNKEAHGKELTKIVHILENNQFLQFLIGLEDQYRGMADFVKYVIDELINEMHGNPLALAFLEKLGAAGVRTLIEDTGFSKGLEEVVVTSAVRFETVLSPGSITQAFLQLMKVVETSQISPDKVRQSPEYQQVRSDEEIWRFFLLSLIRQLGAREEMHDAIDEEYGAGRHRQELVIED